MDIINIPKLPETVIPSDISELTDTTGILDAKVDVVAGKGLSTNDFTDDFETKLNDLPLAADIPADISDLTDTTGLIPADLSELTDTTGILTAKVDVVAGKGLSTNDFTDDFETKLTGIDAGAQVNVIPDLSELTDSTGILTAKVDVVAGKGLSTNDFTDDLETKLTGIDAGANNYVHPTGDGNLHVPANGTTNNGEVLTAGATAGVYSWEPIPLPADIEIVPLIDPIVNISSQGDTYIDVTGDTYSETEHQTRSTAPSVKRNIAFYGDAHVSAGTGTIAVYNVTDDEVIGSTTTTSTTRANVIVGVVAADTNNSDVLTIKVKNDTAGESITIDHGGFMIVENWSGMITETGLTNLLSSMGMQASKIKNMKLVIMGSSATAATITARVVSSVVDGSGVFYTTNITTNELTESLEGTIITSNLLAKLQLCVDYMYQQSLKINTTAITGQWMIGYAAQQVI